MPDLSTEPAAVRVPFVDLSRSNRPVRDAVLARLAELIDRGEFGSGATVREFEAAFARFCGRAACAGSSSGLDALRLALRAAGVEPGAEVLVPANTFVATFEAISQAGGVPVPVDASLADYNLDVEAAEAAVSGATQAVVPVHLYGQLADMRAVGRLARRHGLVVVEDACQAHGAARDGVRPGDLAAAAAFSFYPAKNLGAMGDAGAVVADDAALVERVRVLREHGQERKYAHVEVGWTARLDAFQAAVLLAKLEHLDAWTAERRALALGYRELLAGVGDLALPPVATGSDPVWHLFVVATADPAALAEHLRRRGIATGRHYPQPPHLSPAYAHLGLGAGAFPVAEGLAGSLLSLPLFPGMSGAQLEAVAAAARAFFGG